MQAKQAIKGQIDLSTALLTRLLEDLSDADLLVRPVPGANHAAWQLGHLISSEAGMHGNIPGAVSPELPADFVTNHGKDRAGHDGPDGFLTKAQYLDLFTKVRGATLAALEKLPEADLDQPTTGRAASFAPTVGALLALTGGHVLMHVGQVSVIRRKLGKPHVM